MTRLQTFIAWCVVLLALLTTANAQTVDDIINRYTDAIGGQAVLAGIHSVQIEGTMTSMGDSFPVKVTVVSGKAYRSESSTSGSTIVQCVTDTGAWSVNPMFGTSSPQVLSADQAKAMRSVLYIEGPLVNYKSKGFSAELVGRENIQGVSAYKVHLFDNAGTDVMYDLDPNTYLILQAISTSNVGGMALTTTSIFSNYQKTPIGYTMAYATNTSSQMDFDITYSKVEFNQAIDPQICAVPK